MFILLCFWYLNFKGGQLYHIPLVMSCRDRVALCCLRGPAVMSLVPSSAIVNPCCDSVRGVCRGGVVYGGGARLPKQCQAGPVFPLRSLHTDLVRRHPWPSDVPVCGRHQSDCDPTLDISARLWVGLSPLWCKETGYPFQGSRRLHSE